MIKPTSPDKCFVACCFPLDKASCLASWEMGEDRDFLRSQFQAYINYKREAIWEMYAPLASDIRRELEQVRSTGCTLKTEFTLKDLSQIEGFEVFLLLTHNNKDRKLIELFDGLYTYPDFCEGIPLNFSGSFDLSACNSALLRDEIKKRFGNQVISFKVDLPVIQHIVFSKHILINLNKFRINYLDCYTKTIHDLLN